jgi:hypothetical protein
MLLLKRNEHAQTARGIRRTVALPGGVPQSVRVERVGVAGVVAFVVLAGGAFAQGVSSQTPAAPVQLPGGTTICAVLQKTVDAKKAKVGGAIFAKTTMPVLSHGKILIANGATLKGHITEAKARSHDDRESRLGIVFDRLVVKSGETPLGLTVQAVGYGGLTTPEDDARTSPFTATNTIYSSTADITGRHPQFPPPRPEPSDTPAAQNPGRLTRSPALDAGSKGAIGFTGLTLIEGSDAARGSVITATKKNVKLERGNQLILRVIAQPAEPGSAAKN